MIDFYETAMLFLKIIILLGLVVYIIFAGVIVRQEQLMSHVLEEGFEPVIRVLAIIHFVASCMIFILALVVL